MNQYLFIHYLWITSLLTLMYYYLNIDFKREAESFTGQGTRFFFSSLNVKLR